MPNPTPSLTEALAEIRRLILDPERFIRAVASGRQRNTTLPWRRLELRPVDLKAGRHLQSVAYDERQAHTSNAAFGPAAAAAVDAHLALPFATWHVETTELTLQLRITKKGEAMVSRSRPPADAATGGEVVPDTAHNRAKQRLLAETDPFWQALGIAGPDGRIKPTRMDKFRQVDAFVRALDATLKEAKLPAAVTAGERPLRVVDLGCGNAYLTFAAYRFLTHVRGLDVAMVGVDVKEQAKQRNTELAAKLGWAGLSFVQGSIAEAAVDGFDAGAGEVGGADVVLALHACDTATDDALARAVHWQAPVVLAAPCCHHDIQAQIKGAGTAPAPWTMMLRHGILRERFADVLTDTIRALLLRQAGYRVEVVEFIASEHTPRNTLLRALRTGAAPDPALTTEYTDLVQSWRITPKLATLIGPAGF